MQEEKYDTRDRSYSIWHRRLSTRRFVGIERAQTLAMIDLDAALYVEYDDGTKEPLALIETARDIGQSFKSATITKALARRMVPTVPALILLYLLSDEPNPSFPSVQDIKAFRYMRVWPEPVTVWKTVTPQQWADKLVKLREWSAEKLDRHEDWVRKYEGAA